MSTEHLSRIPGLARPYLRAGLGALPLSRRPQTLPDRQLVLPGVMVDRGHLAEYSRVCGFGVTDALPGTYPHVLSFPLQLRLMSSRTFPFPLLGLVHVANRIEVTRDVRADETLTVTVRAANLQPHERGHQVELVTEMDVAGERVWASTSTYLHRSGGSSTGGSSAGGAGTGNARSGTERGTVEPGALWHLDGGLGRRYAAVSGDRNPIHLHPLTARAFGFPRAIAHGMWTAARCLAALQGRLPAAYVQQVSFHRPVLLPATVAFTAEHVGGGWALELRDARRGTPHLSGNVSPAPGTTS